MRNIKTAGKINDDIKEFLRAGVVGKMKISLPKTIKLLIFGKILLNTRYPLCYERVVKMVKPM